MTKRHRAGAVDGGSPATEVRPSTAADTSSTVVELETITRRLLQTEQRLLEEISTRNEVESQVTVEFTEFV